MKIFEKNFSTTEAPEEAQWNIIYNPEEKNHIKNAFLAFCIGATYDASASGVGYAVAGTTLFMPVGLVIGSALALFFLNKSSSWNYEESASMVLN